MNTLTILVVMALIITIASLAWGVGSMAHGGSYDRQYSEKLMFTRVAMQAVAFALIVVALILSLN